MRETEYYEVYDTDATGEFDNQVERFIKKKRYKQLPNQIEELEEQLAKGEFPGTMIRKANEPIPYEVYKLRMPNPDTNVGKSNGYRVMYIVVSEQKLVVLVAIYYKKEQTTVTDTYIEGLIDGYFLDSVPYDDSGELDA